MDESDLEDLLRAADAEAGEPRALLDGLAPRARQIVSRRRTVRRWSAGGGLALLAACIALVVWPDTPATNDAARTVPRTAGSAEETVDAAVELRRLRFEADSRSAVVHGLLADQRRRARLAELERMAHELGVGSGTAAPRVGNVAVSIDAASLRLLQAADRMHDDPRLRFAAGDAYERVIRLYPGSLGATAAQKKLIDADSEKGTPS
jgi:hypothetical protein